MSITKKYRVTIGDKVYEVEVEVKEPKEIKDNLLKFISKAKVIEKTIKETPISQLKGNIIRAPISGKIVKILAKEGEEVKKGDLLAIIESMKTRIEVISNVNGVVKRILIKESDFVRTRQEMIVLE